MKKFKGKILVKMFVSILLITSCIDDDIRYEQDGLDELNNYISENKIEIQPSINGVYYIESEAGTGDEAERYDTVKAYFSISKLNGEVISTNNEGVEFVVGQQYVYGFDEALTNMNVGAKGRAIVPYYMAYGSQETGDFPAYSNLIYDIEVLEIKKGVTVESFNVDTLQVNSTSSGLRYYIVKECPDSAKVYSGDYVLVQYTGYLSDGTIFDSSAKRGDAAQFQVGVGKLIKGWDEGVVLMQKGEKFKFIIPSDLAYGASGSFPNIPPNEVLTFDIEVLDIFY